MFLDTCVLRIPIAAFLRLANACAVVDRQPRYTRDEVVAYAALVRGIRYGTLGQWGRTTYFTLSSRDFFLSIYIETLIVVSVYCMSTFKKNLCGKNRVRRDLKNDCTERYKRGLNLLSYF